MISSSSFLTLFRQLHPAQFGKQTVKAAEEHEQEFSCTQPKLGFKSLPVKYFLTERGSSVELPLRLVVQLVAADDVAAEDDERRDDDEERDGGAEQDHLGRVQPLEPAPPQRVHAKGTQLAEARVDVVPRRRVVGLGRPQGAVGGRLPRGPLDESLPRGRGAEEHGEEGDGACN